MDALLCCRYVLRGKKVRGTEQTRAPAEDLYTAQSVNSVEARARTPTHWNCQTEWNEPDRMLESSSSWIDLIDVAECWGDREITGWKCKKESETA